MDLRAFAHHFEILADLFFKDAVFGNQLLAVQGIAHRGQQAVEVRRLGDVVEGPHAHGLYGSIQIAMAGDHDKRGLRLGFTAVFQDLHPIHLGHLYITKDQVIVIFFQFFQAFSTVLGFV